MTHALSLSGMCLQVLTGGNDKTAILYDRSTEKKVATLVGHTKRVSRVALHPVADVLLTASEDKTVRVWSPAGSSMFSLSLSLSLSLSVY